jgi:hypothetical protein
VNVPAQSLSPTTMSSPPVVASEIRRTTADGKSLGVGQYPPLRVMTFAPVGVALQAPHAFTPIETHESRRSENVPSSRSSRLVASAESGK